MRYILMILTKNTGNTKFTTIPAPFCKCARNYKLYQTCGRSMNGLHGLVHQVLEKRKQLYKLNINYIVQHLNCKRTPIGFYTIIGVKQCSGMKQTGTRSHSAIPINTRQNQYQRVKILRNPFSESRTLV